MGARRGLALPGYPNPIEHRTTVWEAIGDLPDADRFDEWNSADAVRIDWMTEAAYARHLRGLECNTLRAGTDSARGAFTSPRPIHPFPFLPRVVTVREAARLHSYPDWFRFHSTKWHGFRQIGNSVPPLLARFIAREIVKALGVEPLKPKEVLQLGAPNLLTFGIGDAAEHFCVPRDTIAQRTRSKNPDQQDLWREAYA